MSELANIVARRRADVVLAVVAMACLVSCRGAPESSTPTPVVVDRGAELAALRERLNKLTAHIDALYEQQQSRLSAIEMRANQLEARQLQAEGTANEVATVHAEIAQLRLDITALGAEHELDQLYRERLERLEHTLAATVQPPPGSVDDIWSWYVGQRDEIRRLGEQLTSTPPHP